MSTAGALLSDLKVTFVSGSKEMSYTVATKCFGNSCRMIGASRRNARPTVLVFDLETLRSRDLDNRCEVSADHRTVNNRRPTRGAA